MKRKKDKFKDAYDQKCVEILSYKIILANIMKRCIHEYKDVDVSTIRNCIEYQNNSEKILGLKKDFKYLTYDIFFHSKIPNSKDAIGLFINLEPQKTSKKGYNMFDRGLFYASNAINYQYDRIFKNSHYEKLKKVYSIFVCMDAPSKKEENSITYFHLTKDIKIGYNMYEGYDKLCIIVIYLGFESSKDELLRFFELLFSSDLQPQFIVDTLNEEYGIEVSEEFIAEVNEMCNLSDRIEERALKKGKP